MGRLGGRKWSGNDAKTLMYEIVKKVYVKKKKKSLPLHGFILRPSKFPVVIM